ncbi:hypothetical protein HU200_034541 [Digitaria exilis]|uniref:DUF4220 domain-containing protein n=1 Tax=Digitaria exilis TaxID=1010633 RepID=A0A835EJT9_9POAL|nr:hypothetical protein HU200_034541 [Digitaria exilis]
MDQLHQLGDSSNTPILKEGEYHEHDARPHPPALVVMGEDNVQVDSQPCGYRFKWIPGDSDKVVTLDRVWKLHAEMLRSCSTVQPKYLGFSFTLFKILRRRFAKYTISSASFTKAQKFVRYTLIKGSGASYERAFGVVADELSFLHDYYNSSQPIYYSHHGLVIFSIILSLYSIGYCIYLMVTYIVLWVKGYHHSQIYCSDECFDEILRFDFAGRYSDVLPLYLVAVVLVLAEARDILFYICSNWTKVSLIYHYVNQASWQQSPIMKKCISVVFKYCSSKRVNNWDDRIKQCSILDRPSKLIAHLPSRLQRLHNHKKKVKLPNAVKAAIFEALKRKCLTSVELEGSVMYVQRPSCPVPCDTHAELIDGGNCTAYTILAWHIATTVFEVQQQQQQPLVPEWQHKVAATHLSRYCAYLVACCPELLPDENDEWCKSLYENAKKEAAHVLSMPQGAMRTYPLLDESWLSAQSTQSVLKDGASLGKQLLDSGIGWEPLARFWSEMILYVAPSENLEAQAEAVARGGELITLLWTLLSHAGIDRRHW